MARYQVILAYDGTDFQGFQRQAKTRTVQGVVETALASLGWQRLKSGRTDNIATLQPIYLRLPPITKSKKKY